LEVDDEWQSVEVAGSAGNILVFDADLVHAGSRNATGARRRTILIGYFAEPLFASHLETANLRGIRMDTAERFDPSGLARGNPHSDDASMVIVRAGRGRLQRRQAEPSAAPDPAPDIGSGSS